MDSKSFFDYYTEGKRDYTFKLKFAKCDLTEEDLESIECCLNKHNLKNMGSFKKTPLQENPLDFPSVKNTAVHICEVTVEYPMTPDAMRRELAEATGVSEMCIAVYHNNDPRDEMTEQVLERGSDEFKDNYEPALGSDWEFEAEPAYGEEHNKSILKDLADARKNRRTDVVTNDLIPDAKTDGETVTGPETGAQNNTSVLNDPKQAEKYIPKRKNSSLFSKN